LKENNERPRSARRAMSAKLKEGGQGMQRMCTRGNFEEGVSRKKRGAKNFK
jgi:hypothetical protein